MYTYYVYINVLCIVKGCTEIREYNSLCKGFGQSGTVQPRFGYFILMKINMNSINHITVLHGDFLVKLLFPKKKID